MRCFGMKTSWGKIAGLSGMTKPKPRACARRVPVMISSAFFSVLTLPLFFLIRYIFYFVIVAVISRYLKIFPRQCQGAWPLQHIRGHHLYKNSPWVRILRAEELLCKSFPQV